MRESLSTITVRAKLRLKTTAEGGRQNGIKTGYRPNHVFEYVNDKWKSGWIGEITFDETEWIQLGEDRIVTVRFISNTEFEKYMYPGRRWWLHEGLKLVGEAEIIEVLSRE
jgi:hypothetical protein